MKNIFVYKLFYVIKNFRFSFFMWKLFQASPSKNLDTIKSPFPTSGFEILEEGSHPPTRRLTPPPSRKGRGVGAHYAIL